MFQTITGNLGVNPTVHHTGLGEMTTDFTLAVNENGHPTATWVNITACNGLGERQVQDLRKGDFVKVIGHLATERFFDPWSGEEITILNMTASDIQTLWRKPVAA